MVTRKKDCCVPLEECFLGKYDISLKVNIFLNLSLSTGARGSVTTTSSLSQPLAHTSPKEVVQSTNITHDPHRDVTSSHLTPIILAPLKHLSLQPNTSHTLTHAQDDTSTKHLTSFNENTKVSPTISTISDPILFIRTPPKACSSFISNPSNSTTGSISINLNQDQTRPYDFSQAHSSPIFSSPIVLTTSSSNLLSNTLNSPAKKHPPKHNPYIKHQPHPPYKQKSSKALIPV